MSVEVQGIIVEYSGMCGIVLIRHRSYQTLDELARAYAASKIDKGFWFAKFLWKSIPIESRVRLTSSQARSRRRSKSRPGQSRPKKAAQIAASEAAVLRNKLLGCAVECRVQKTPKWEAFDLSLAFAAARFDLPLRRIRQNSNDRGSARAQRNAADERAARMSRKGENNLYKPFGGV